MKIRVGIGFDIHRLEPGLPLTIGGVRVQYEKGLVGHSDGDVLLHAVIDALLGASGLGNIGEHFPDDDPDLAGIDSRSLLGRTAVLVRDEGFDIGNIDSNVIAQQPRLLPYLAGMGEVIANAVDVSPGAVQVKAKTMDGLGAIGRAEAIAAQAVALILTR